MATISIFMIFPKPRFPRPECSK